MAINDFNKAIQLNPQYAAAFNVRGLSLLKSGKSDDAITDFTKSIEIEPDYAYAYYNRGITYWEMKKTDQAAFDLRQFIKLGAGDIRLMQQIEHAKAIIEGE